MNSQFSELSDMNEEDLLRSSLEQGDEAEGLLSEVPNNLLLQNIEVTTDRAEGRQRQISAKIQIPYSVTQIWQILTDYDHLADFIPNLSKSQRIQHPQGGIRIEQIGTESLLRLKFCARVVLDMVEHFPHRLDFNMVEGDFKVFQGSWLLQPLGDSNTELCYKVVVLPPRMMPVQIIERRLSSGLVLNLSAIYQRAEALFEVQ